MDRIPSMRLKNVRFRDQTNSEDYNQMQEDLYYDMTQLFDMANELTNEIDETNGLLKITSHFQQLRIRRLENEIEQLQSEIESLQSNSSLHRAYVFLDKVHTDYNAPTSEQGYIDSTHGVAHLPITGELTSKVYVYDEIEEAIFQPDTLEVETIPVEGLNAGVKAIENDPYNAVNGNNSSYWNREIIAPLEHVPDKPVKTEYIVTMPDTIISNREVNMIYVHPFPLNSITINKIEYRLDGDWKVIPGWPKDDAGEPVPYINTKNLKFCFPDTAMRQVKVTMTQDEWVEDNTMKVYHFGLQELGIFHADYQSSVGKVTFEMELPDENQTYIIEDMKPVFSNASVLSDKTENKLSLFSYHVYSVNDQGEKEYLKNSFPIRVPSNKLYIEASIHRDTDQNTTPVLESVELTYRKV